MTQHDEAARQSYYLARLEATDGREWFSLHWTSEDAERQLKAVGVAWGVGFTVGTAAIDGRYVGSTGTSSILATAVA